MTKVAEVMRLVEDVERAPTREHAQAAKSCIAVLVAGLTGEDVQAAFDAVRPAPEKPLAVPGPHRAVRLVSTPNESLEKTVKALTERLDLKPWVDE